MSVVISVRMEDTQVEALDMLAGAARRTRSAEVVMAVEAWLDSKFPKLDKGVTEKPAPVPSAPQELFGSAAPKDEFDYTGVAYEDCPPHEQKRRREEALAKRGLRR